MTPEAEIAARRGVGGRAAKRASKSVKEGFSVWYTGK